MAGPTNGNDFLTGGGIVDGQAGDDIIIGGAGADILSGGLGNDILSGGGGADILNGGRGADILLGGGGADILDGGAGSDILTGGAGGDVFRFLNVGNDIVTDFKASQGDVLQIDNIAGIFTIADLTITQVGGNVVITAPSNPAFQITLQNTNVADVTSSLQVACLLRGTMVATPDGEVAVEALAVGDLVSTVDGVAKPVKWIGKRAYAGPFARGNARVTPVKISAGALGDNVPSRDLFVSPEHAVLVDGVLVPAQHLVNGSTIVAATGIDVIEYFHVEFDTPQVLMTNGAPTESYVDEGSRQMFANYAEYVELYGETAGNAVTSRRFPLVEGGAELEAIQARLATRLAVAA
ncbi:MAG: Hint domain-containing protein [Beijerinckiaceae bacterium]|nr:Hint domain-containing protein [Beijerinckiaceae bacterium]